MRWQLIHGFSIVGVLLGPSTAVPNQVDAAEVRQSEAKMPEAERR
jgi:hypothetical protein